MGSDKCGALTGQMLRSAKIDDRGYFVKYDFDPFLVISTFHEADHLHDLCSRVCHVSIKTGS